MIRFFLTGFLLSLVLMASAQTISGTITNAEGTPVPGVHVYCLGENSGEVSDANGQYSFDPQGCGQIVFRHLHYKEKTLKNASSS